MQKYFLSMIQSFVFQEKRCGVSESKETTSRCHKVKGEENLRHSLQTNIIKVDIRNTMVRKHTFYYLDIVPIVDMFKP